MKHLTDTQLDVITRTIALLDSLTSRNLIDNEGAWKETIRAKVELEALISTRKS